MKQLRQILFLTILAIGTFACKKDDEVELNPKVQALARNNWITTAFTVNPAAPVFDDEGNPTGQFRTDLFSDRPSYEKDDVLKFYTNQTYVFDEGATKERPDFGQVFEAGDWYLSVDENTVVLKSGSFSGIGAIYDDGFFETQDRPTLVNWKVEELTQSSLKVSFQQVAGSTTYTLTRTFAPAN
jgi:hypothetical protein